MYWNNTDITPQNGITYYYVITALNSVGESNNSNMVQIPLSLNTSQSATKTTNQSTSYSSQLPNQTAQLGNQTPSAKTVYVKEIPLPRFLSGALSYLWFHS